MNERKRRSQETAADERGDDWKKRRDAYAEQCWRLRKKKYYLFRDAFPWFAPAMVEAGLDLFHAKNPVAVHREESPAVRETWHRADHEWTARTELNRLDCCDIESWQAVAVAAGYTAIEARRLGLEELYKLARLVLLGAKPAAGGPVDRQPQGTPAAGGDAKPPETCNAVYPTPDNYERDKWIYEQHHANKTIREIHEGLEQRAHAHDWEPLTSDNGIREAWKRYARHHGLLIKKGRSGPKR